MNAVEQNEREFAGFSVFQEVLVLDGLPGGGFVEMGGERQVVLEVLVEKVEDFFSFKNQEGEFLLFFSYPLVHLFRFRTFSPF